MTPHRFLLLSFTILLHFSTFALARPQAFEISPEQASELPKGKEADGIIGDIVLRNDRICALIAQNAPLRRANMSTFYGADAMTPGCLYDLTLLSPQDDQITCFAPGQQKGKVSWVRIADEGSKGMAVVEVVLTAPANKGLAIRHAYELQDSWQGLRISSTYKNESQKPTTVTLSDKWTGLGKGGTVAGLRWAEAIDPDDNVGYAVEELPESVVLAPGEEKSFQRYLTVGRHPLAAVSALKELKGEALGKSSFSLKEPHGQPATATRILINLGGKEPIPARPDENGLVSLALPIGEHQLSAEEIGRSPTSITLSIDQNLVAKGPSEIMLPPQSSARFTITDDQGRSLPCKVQFAPADPQQKLDLGPAQRAHGCVDQWHSETGSFRVPLPPGKYAITVTRGVEYSHLKQEVAIEAGKEVSIVGSLKRMVDTTGWVSSDFHNHSTPSGDNTCGTEDRLINLVAEHIEFAPTTEHNRLFDWAPLITSMQLTPWLQTVSGIELTGSGQHINSFPFTPTYHTQDNGAPVWVDDPRIVAHTIRDFQKQEPDRWIQVNHPDLERVFKDRNKDNVPDGGFVGVGQYVDAWEIENFTDCSILGTAPYKLDLVKGSQLARRVTYVREFIWRQLLNQGHRLLATAVADAHTVHGNGVGGWRVYLPSSTDEPAKIDWREMSRASKAGRGLLTTGPFMTLTASSGTANALPGQDLAAPGGDLTLSVKVQCNDWVEIDRILIMINGRVSEEYTFTKESHPNWFKAAPRVFEQVIPIHLKEDAHLMVIAWGEKSSLATGFGSSPQAKMHPCAYFNPIWVDTDGNGFKANGDTLGHDIPTANLSVEKVQELLKGKGH